MFSEFVRMKLKHSGDTISGFACKVNVSRRTVERWVADQHLPKKSQILSLIKNLSLTELEFNYMIEKLAKSRAQQIERQVKKEIRDYAREKGFSFDDKKRDPFDEWASDIEQAEMQNM